MYTVKGLSIGAIARLLRETGPPTRRRVTRRERSVVWAILRTGLSGRPASTRRRSDQAKGDEALPPFGPGGPRRKELQS